MIYDTNMQLVTFINKTQQIMLQAQRGNFELHKSKLITKNHIKNLLINERYAEAIDVAVSNFIDFSIVTETKIKFVDFFGSFTNDNAYTNCVVQIYNFMNNKKEKKQHKAENNNKNEENIKNLDEFTTKLGLDIDNQNDKNTEFDCAENFLYRISTMLVNSPRYIVVLSKLNKIEDALLYAQNTKLEYIHILKNYFAEEEIIKESLGLYDFAYTKKVIEMLQKDLYLDFIEMYKDEDEIEKRIMINKLLQRENKVVFYLSQTNDIERESKYIKDANVHEILLALENHIIKTENVERKQVDNRNIGCIKQGVNKYESGKTECMEMQNVRCNKNNATGCLFTFLNANDKFITACKREQGYYVSHYADYVYKSNKKDAIQYYIAAKKYIKATEVAFEIEDFDYVLEINQNHTNEQAIYKKCIEGYMTKMNYKKVAEIYLLFLNDKKNAYNYYLMEHNYVKCFEIEHVKFLDEKSKYLENDIQIIKQNVEYIKENIKRFDDVLKRTKDNGDETLTETTFSSQRSKKSTKTKLRNKIGSRYEKEYALDQIRQTINKIKQIQNSWREMNVVSEEKSYVEVQEKLQKLLQELLQEIENDYDRVFAYENIIYDPDRPIIEKIDIKDMY
ncbi:hypothetical protein BDAP_002664 [Binucleata daphniae]